MDQKKTRKPFAPRYLITGVITVIPIWLTWLVFNFLFTQLSPIGRFLLDTLSIQQLVHPFFISLLGVIVTLVAFYLIGWMATLVIGKRIIALFDAIIDRVPFVQTVYGSIKKLLSALEQKPEGTQRVVLIDFPSPPMKTVGLVTHTLTDEKTGQKIAAVYVPTTPNPTSGYLELIPLDNVTSTNWTLDEAMTFIMSGGTVAPDNLSCS